MIARALAFFSILPHWKTESVRTPYGRAGCPKGMLGKDYRRPCNTSYPKSPDDDGDDDGDDDDDNDATMTTTFFRKFVKK